MPQRFRASADRRLSGSRRRRRIFILSPLAHTCRTASARRPTDVRRAPADDGAPCESRRGADEPLCKVFHIQLAAANPPPCQSRESLASLLGASWGHLRSLLGASLGLLWGLLGVSERRGAPGSAWTIIIAGSGVLAPSRAPNVEGLAPDDQNQSRELSSGTLKSTKRGRVGSG